LHLVAEIIEQKRDAAIARARLRQHALLEHGHGGKWKVDVAVVIFTFAGQPDRVCHNSHFRIIMIRVLLLLCMARVSAATIELTGPELAGIIIGSVTIIAGLSIFLLLCYIVYCFHFR
jgi:hypothetical protein